jgi:hypothetical protein
VRAANRLGAVPRASCNPTLLTFPSKPTAADAALVTNFVPGRGARHGWGLAGVCRCEVPDLASRACMRAQVRLR